MQTHGITDANLKDWASTSSKGQQNQDGGVPARMADIPHDEDSNFSDSSFMEGQHALTVDPEVSFCFCALLLRFLLIMIGDSPKLLQCYKYLICYSFFLVF